MGSENRPSLFGLYALVIFLAATQRAGAIGWLALKEEDVRGWSEGAADDIVSDEGAVCDRAKEMGVYPCSALLYVAKAATLAKTTCKQMHALRRWNCSNIDLAPNFTPDLMLGTKEQSFVYALSSAALTYTMARACASGALFSCTCGRPSKERPNGNFKWGGCSDNVKWAGRFVRQFLDKKHVEESKYEEDSAEENHAKMMEERNKISKRVYGNLTDYAFKRKGESLVKRELSKENRKRRKKGRKPKPPKPFDDVTFTKKYMRLRPAIHEINQVNTKAGWRAMERNMAIECKCHGVSGSCSVKTCWRTMESLSEVLYRLWRSAKRVQRSAAPNAKSWGGRSSDLVYVTRSPSYCAVDPNTGSLGTKDRWCNATLRSSEEGSCRYMCCGRGYKTFTNETLERCNCKYIWCCKVECDVCKTITNTYYCN